MRNKVGIIAPGAAGDLLLTTCILPHAAKLWPDHDVIWFAMPQFSDLLAHNPYIAEVRPFHEIGDCKAVRQAGTEFIYGTRVDLDKARELKVKCLTDLDAAYFSTPWLVGGVYWGFTYCDLVKHIFGLPTDTKPWHPVLEWKQEEDARAEVFMQTLHTLPCVMLETVCKSNQSAWTDDVTRQVMQKCREYLGPCHWIFASRDATLHTGVGGEQSILMHDWTIRQLVPVFNRCVLFVGCASGISTATTCWKSSEKVPRFLFHNSPMFSSHGNARGPNFEACKQWEINAQLDKALTVAKEYRSSRRM